MVDIVSDAVTMSWEGDDTDPVSAVMFKKGSICPKDRQVTFPCEKAINVTVSYDRVEDLPEGTNPVIAKYAVSGMSGPDADAPEDAKPPRVRLILDHDKSGVLTLKSAENIVEIAPEVKVE